MKNRIIALLIIFFSCSVPALSQKVIVGLKGGASLGKIAGRSFKDEFTLGYHAGFFVTVGGKKWAIQPEVLWGQISSDTSSKFSDIYSFNRIKKIKLQALHIPVLVSYHLCNVLSLQAGPQFGIVLDKNRNLLQNGKEAFKAGDLAVAGGLELNIKKFRAYGRYTAGLSDLKNIDAKDSWKAQTILLGIGFAL